MNFVLTIYTEHAYREVFLPELDNSDYHLFLRAAEYTLSDDVVLPMEVIDGYWRFKKIPGCRIESSGMDYTNKNLFSSQILHITTKQNESIAIMVWEKPEHISAYPKYAVIGAERIRIGRSPGNDILCGSQSIVSGEHAELVFRSGQNFIRDCSTNGTYLNNKRVNGSQELHFGDVINIFGLTIIYMEEIVAINSLVKDAEISSRYLFRIDEADRTAPVLPGVVPSEAETMIHIAPRTIPTIHEEPEKIETFPPKKEGDQKPAWMAVLPSLTMVLPMIIGFC